MPFLNLKLNAPAPKEVADKIAARLTELTAEHLKKQHDLTVVVLDEAQPGHWYLAGRPTSNDPRPTFYLDVKVTEGTNTKDQKARFAEAAFSELQQLLGSIDATSYIVIHELRADSWGYQGQTQEFRSIASRTI